MHSLSYFSHCPAAYSHSFAAPARSSRSSASAMSLSRAAGRFISAASAAANAASSRTLDALDRVALRAYSRFGPPAGLELATLGGAGALPPQVLRRYGAASSLENNSLAGLLSGIWFAVPKRKASVRRKTPLSILPSHTSHAPPQCSHPTARSATAK